MNDREKALEALDAIMYGQSGYVVRKTPQELDDLIRTELRKTSFEDAVKVVEDLAKRADEHMKQATLKRVIKIFADKKDAYETVLLAFTIIARKEDMKAVAK